jgi:glycosyltransferase involved in cell wall biosynthesis
MTAITKVVVDALERRAVVRKFDWSRGKPLRGRRWKLARFWGALKTLVRLPLAGRARGAKLYYPVSAGIGLFCDIAIAAVARLMGYRLVLHHHVYTYITRPDWRIAVLDRLVGRGGAHVVYCDMMREDFLRRYPSRSSFLIVPPTIVAQQLERIDSPPRDTFTIGFLSNLTFPKGVQDAIDTFTSLANQGHPVRLILAGPCMDGKVQAAVDKAVAQWPGRVEHWGAVYGREKAKFFAELDAFLFPTRHRHESWGIVLNEALAYGCPVVARAPGCVSWIVRDGCGVLVESGAEFIGPAAAAISRWIADPQAHQDARAAARRRAAELEAQAQEQLPQFVDQLLNLGRTTEAVSRPHLTFVGALPPPVTGMTAMTAVIVDALRCRAIVRCFNWSRGKPLAGWRWKFARAWGAFESFFRLLAGGRGRGETLYYAVSRRGGLFYDIAIASLSRALGYRPVLHHHSYTYIDRHDWRAALLDRLASAHVVHCETMRQDFLRQYDSKVEFLFVPPTIVAQQLEPIPPPPHSTFTLGFLSCLMIEKGLDEVIATFERLAQSGADVRLILAGPYHSTKEKRLVEAAVAKWPTRIDYRGPVYGHKKTEFFADIHAFLFPTRYSAESWGIVLTEALAAGRPVLARSRACVRWIVGGGCGLVVDPGADFVSVAAAQIKAWMDAPEVYGVACAAARTRSAELQEDANRQFPEFVRRVIDRTPGTPSLDRAPRRAAPSSALS